MPRVVRDIVLFIAGLVGVFHEMLVRDEVRAELLMIFGAMLGLPLFLRSDEARSDPPLVDRRQGTRKKKITMEELVSELERRAKMVTSSYRNTIAYVAAALAVTGTFVIVSVR